MKGGYSSGLFCSGNVWTNFNFMFLNEEYKIKYLGVDDNKINEF
jgi:hypothetical protein